MAVRALHGPTPGVNRPPSEPRKLFSEVTASGPVAEERELWIGVHLPHLAIEALPRASRSIPIAIIELEGQTQYVVAACEIAQRGGVKPQMSMAAALSLVPTLETHPRNTQREQQLLEQLAMRAQRFTPRVSLVPPDGLLLEV